MEQGVFTKPERKNWLFNTSNIALAASMLAVAASPVAAQEADTEELMSLEEIVVTSQKRAQSLQEVPLHVQAITEGAFQRAQITRVEEVINLSPTVTFSARRGYDQTSIRIRGVGTQELGAGVEPSVATVVDGVVMARGGSTFNELPDIERVEILNGPQGTLFGKNASVGLINIVTKKPSVDALEGSFRMRATSDQDYSGNFSINAPLSDNLAIRASGFWRNWDGNVENVVTDRMVNGVDALGMRAKLLWLPSDDFEVLFSADYSRQNTECCARLHRMDKVSPADASGRPDDPDIDAAFVNYNGINVAGGTLSGSAADILGPEITIGPENDKIAQNFDPFQGSNNGGFSLEMNKDLGEHTLTSLTAYREWQSTNGWDNDFTPFPFQERQQHERDVNWFSQELRLTSPASDTFDYILGLYFYKSNTIAQEISDRTTIDTGQDQFFIVDSDSSYKNIAVFGHTNVALTEDFKLFGGFRLLNDEAEATGAWTYCQGNDSFVGAPDFNCATPSQSAKKDDTKFIYKLGAQYFLTEDINAYAFYSTGYKGRGFSLEFGFNPARLASGAEPIAGEESKSIEVGIKGSAFDNRLQFNAVYYNTTIDGLQQSLRDLNTIANVLGSVAETKTKGFELGATALVSDEFSISASYGYNDAYYSDFVNSNCYLGQTEAQGCVGNLHDRTGDSLEASPKHRIVGSARYESQEDGLRPFAQANVRWQSEANYSSNGDPDALQDAYGIVDISAGFSSEDDSYTVSFFAKNLFDTKFVQGLDVNGPDMGGVLLHYLPRDFNRYFGVSFDYRF